MGYEALQTDRRTSSFVTLVSSLSLSLSRLHADISKVTVHERIQHFYFTVDRFLIFCIKINESLKNGLFIKWYFLNTGYIAF
jgi:hypothetical protein